MENLPTELILEIPHHLPSLHDVASLAQTSRRLHGIVNPVLYKRDVQSGSPTAPFWAAEHGSVPTLRHAHAAGADLDETRLFSKPRGEMSDPYGAFTRVQVQKAKKRRYSAGATGGVSVTTSTSFLDWNIGSYVPPRFWWHPLDLAAFFGHAAVVRYLAGAGVSMSLSRSKGLCEFNCRPEAASGSSPLRVAEVPVRPHLDWAIHSPMQIARCAGHRDVAVLIHELGQVETGRELTKDKEKNVDMTTLLERVAVDPAAFSYRDFVLERF